MRLCENSIRKWSIAFSKCAWHPLGVKSPRQPCNTGKLAADQAFMAMLYLFFHRRSALEPDSKQSSLAGQVMLALAALALERDRQTTASTRPE
jgi:hypothetical protein